MTTLFISDLHLQAARPDIAHAFGHFLRTRAAQADTLYILGDFFEYWIGDDFQTPFERQIMDALKRLSDSGVALYFMHGNRDFLVGEQFAAETGCTLLPDPTVIDLYGSPALLMHGDSLCTQDTEYMQFRAMVRNPQWQQQILSKSVEERLAIAQAARRESASQNANKADAIMDVTPAEVEREMRAHAVHLLIHGHTHRPARHHLELDGQPAQRIVLGDWDQHGWVLEATPEHLELQRFALAAQ